MYFEKPGTMSVPDDPPDEVRKLSDKCNVLVTPECVRLVREYAPKDTDVIVAGPPKSGTTWVQHIIHSLRSGGDMEYEVLSEEVPLLEYFEREGKSDISAPQRFQPNMFKTHLVYDLIPKGNAKHIVIIRNPSDAAVSRYNYLENWLYEKDKLSLEEFVEWFYLKPCPPYDIAWNSLEMRFIAKAYPHRHDDGVLLLHYDDLKADLKGCVKLISDFIGIGVGDQKLLDLVTYQASFEFMQKHKDKFDSRQVKDILKINSNPGSYEVVQAIPTKFRNGVSGEGKKRISPDQLGRIDARWKELVEPVCGCASYQEMREKINKELGRSFADT